MDKAMKGYLRPTRAHARDIDPPGLAVGFGLRAAGDEIEAEFLLCHTQAALDRAGGGVIYDVPEAFGTWAPQAEAQFAMLRGSFPDVTPAEPGAGAWFAVFCRAWPEGLERVAPDVRKAHGRHIAEIFPRMALGLRLVAVAAEDKPTWDALYVLSCLDDDQAVATVYSDPYVQAGVWTAVQCQCISRVWGEWSPSAELPRSTHDGR